MNKCKTEWTLIGLKWFVSPRTWNGPFENKIILNTHPTAHVFT